MERQSSVTIGLMGFELASPNKGCEALAYSFVDLIDSLKLGEVHICVLDEMEVDTFRERYPNISFFCVPSRIKDVKHKWISAIRKCDYIFDITMGDSFSDIYSEKYCISLMKRKFFAVLFGKKYILLPQTYGPFFNQKIRKRAVRIINKADSVYSRDLASIDYLKRYGLRRKIEECTDLAFFLPLDEGKYDISSEKINLGINISGLLWKGGFESENQFGLKLDYQAYTRELLSYWANDERYRVHLIAHVIDPREGSHDDDCFCIEKLHEEFPQTVVAPYFFSPIDAKSYIAKMDCFIGARMHATIAALSAGVPVIPVSYSRKFEGLFSSLGYGFVIHGTEYNTDTAIQKTKEYVEGVEVLLEKTREVKKTIDQKMSKFKYILVEKLLGKETGE